MAPALSREFLLLAACSAWPPLDSRSEYIRKLAAAELDHDQFLRLVMRHRVIGLVHDALARAQPVFPPHVSSEISRRATASARKSVISANEALRLQCMFSESGIPAVFMKGSALALLAYGNLGLRHSRDIDLLVSPESTHAATALLERAGYRRKVPPPSFSEPEVRMWLLRSKELLYVHVERGHKVELHVRPFDNPRLLANLANAGSVRIVPFGEKVGVCTFQEEDNFAYLCVHGAVHSWFRLFWLADIGALLARQPEGGIKRLYRAAAARGAGRPAAQAMLLCRRLLGTTLPNDLVKTLSGDRAVRRLKSLAMSAMTADQVPIDRRFGTTRSTVARFLLDRHWRYRLTELKAYLTSPVDILTLPLSERLQILYPVLRLPLWLWRHRNSHTRP